MSKRNPLFSPLSCGIALVLILGLIAVLIVMGGRVFSPGPLTAVHPQNRSLQGFTSHADFESECSRCHAPLLGPTADRCLACHLTVAAQLRTHSGLHSFLTGVSDCATCHSDHLGRDVRITRLNVLEFPHQEATGFTLVRHQTDYDGLPIECTACHSSGGYDFNLAICAECHVQAQSAFMADHQATFGDNCLACHDGGRVEPFDHTAFFPLEGGHAITPCINCHIGGQFKSAPRDCYSCHRADDAHNQELGTECGACHTPSNWHEATLEDHTFPITHKNHGQPIECQVCHVSTFTTYTCYGCHEHNPAKIEHKHLEKGIHEFQNCASCHPTGGEHEE